MEVGTESGRILLVENDEVIREATSLALRRYGYAVDAAPDGLAGLEAFRREEPDAVLLDVMLPRLDGAELCRKIRESSLVPVLLVAARSDPVDVVSGLEAGADDYITKPFEIPELIARLHAVMRRVDVARPVTELPTDDDVRRIGDLRVDVRGGSVTRAGVPIRLTATEMRLLVEFTVDPGTVITRERLLERVWDYARGGDARVVDIHVQRLRAKIGAEWIETVRGFGYKLRV